MVRALAFIDYQLVVITRWYATEITDYGEQTYEIINGETLSGVVEEFQHDSLVDLDEVLQRLTKGG